MRLQEHRGPRGLVSVAHAWRGEGAEAAHAIGVANMLMHPRGKAAAATGAGGASVESGSTRLER